MELLFENSSRLLDFIHFCKRFHLRGIHNRFRRIGERPKKIGPRFSFTKDLDETKGVKL